MFYLICFVDIKSISLKSEAKLVFLALQGGFLGSRIMGRYVPIYIQFTLQFHLANTQ